MEFVQLTPNLEGSLFNIQRTKPCLRFLTRFLSSLAPETKKQIKLAKYKIRFELKRSGSRIRRSHLDVVKNLTIGKYGNITKWWMHLASLPYKLQFDIGV